MNLIGAECVYGYTLDQLRNLNSNIANQLKQKFLRRVQERRNDNLVHLIMFLNNPTYWDAEKDQFGVRIQKHQIKRLATKLVKHLFPADVSELNPSVDLPYDSDDDVGMFEGSPPKELTKAEKLEVRLNVSSIIFTAVLLTIKKSL